MASAHGKYSVEVDGDIIDVSLSGNFNKEGIVAYSERVREAVLAMAGKPFAMLIDSRLIEGGTPDAYDALEKYNHWLSTQKLIAKAVVMKNVVAQAILAQRTPTLTKQNTLYFDNRDDAVKWLSHSLSTHRKTAASNRKN